MTQACITRIATAAPPCDVHTAFVDYAFEFLQNDRSRSLFHHMARRSGIEHRYSFIEVSTIRPGSEPHSHLQLPSDRLPGTARRMEMFERLAPLLLRCALDKLALDEEERRSIGHIVVTCCTGLFAPGLDFVAMEHLELDPGTERTMVGFMGCYAAINGLKLARHIVRSQPERSVLMINLELCSLHFQETQDLEKVLSFLLFADGCAVSLIRAGDRGFAIDSFQAVPVPQSRELIQWRIGDAGFDMNLSSRVPGELRKTLRERAGELDPGRSTDLWAVHPGGRAILDAVDAGLELSPDKLAASRSILRNYGNMSSATVMFVLEQLMHTAQPGQRGCAMSFGPGLTAETMNFHVL